MWPAVLLTLLFLVAPLLQIGFAFLGRALSPGQSGTYSYSVWPTRGEVVGTLTPTFRWPGTAAESYEIDIFEEYDDGVIRWVCSLVSTTNRATVPADTLLEDRTYYWTVSAKREMNGAGMLFSGKFSTVTSITRFGVTVTPAAFHLNLHTLVNGLELRVDSSDDVPVEITLPSGLTSSGDRKVATSGAFSTTVKPSLQVFLLKPEDGETDGRLGEITIAVGRHSFAIPVIVDVSSVGEMLRSIRSGFDPVADTPAFPNFADGVLARLTRGTCLGMVLAAETGYRRCRDCAVEPDCRCTRLRLRSLLTPDAARKEMNFLHLANFDPQNWSLALSSLVTEDGQFNIAAEVLSMLRDGDPVPLAILTNSPDRVEEPEANLGHAVLAYAAHEFDDLYVFYVYDPDEVYNTDQELTSFIAITRTGPDRGRVLGVGKSRVEEIEAYVLPGSKLLSMVSPVVSQSYSLLDTELAQSLGSE